MIDLDELIAEARDALGRVNTNAFDHDLLFQYRGGVLGRELTLIVRDLADALEAVTRGRDAVPDAMTMTEKELIAELREHADEVHAHSTRGAEVMREAADALEARQPSEDDRERLARLLAAQEGEEWGRLVGTAEYARNRYLRKAGAILDRMPSLSRAAAPDAATELTAIKARADEVGEDEGWHIGGAWGDYGEVVVPLRILSYVVDGALDEKVVSTDSGYAATYAEQVARADRAEAERDDLETRLSEYLCDSTGGLLSKTGYDVRTMVAHTEEYYDKVHAEARKEVEAERDAARAEIESRIEDRDYWHGVATRAKDQRDAAVAAIERVAALHVESDWRCGNLRHTNPDVGCPECYTECETCDRTYPCDTRAALDGAPEPEWEYMSDQGAVTDSPENALDRRRKAGPWLPVEGEKP